MNDSSDLKISEWHFWRMASHILYLPHIFFSRLLPAFLHRKLFSHWVGSFAVNRIKLFAVSLHSFFSLFCRLWQRELLWYVFTITIIAQLTCTLCVSFRHTLFRSLHCNMSDVVMWKWQFYMMRYVAYIHHQERNDNEN